MEASGRMLSNASPANLVVRGNGARADFASKMDCCVSWSLGGGEHSLTAIPVVQQLVDEFKCRPEFVALGVSEDADQREVVRQLMGRKKAGFRTMLDQDMRMAVRFQLEGFPTFALIGRGRARSLGQARRASVVEGRPGP